jgi:hypothetical protein
MSRKEIIQSVGNILELFLEFEYIIRNEVIERGYTTEFNKRQRQGVLITDTITDEYNFYQHQHYKKLRDLATELYKLRKNIADIQSRYVYTLCAYFCNSVVDIVDRMLLGELLFPILSYLLGESSNRNKYLIERYYIY